MEVMWPSGKVVAIMNNSLNIDKQSLKINLRLTVEELISITSSNSAKITMALQMVNLKPDILSKALVNLSSTERLLVDLVVVLLENKKIIKLDNFLISFDEHAQRHLILLLKKLAHKYDKTVLISDCDYDLLYSFADLFYFDQKTILNKNQIIRDISNINKKLLPETVGFIDYLNEHHHKQINYYLESKELLKAIYRQE